MDDPIITIDPPTEIDYPVFVGRVSNQFEGISDVTLKIYQNDMLIDSIKTDEDGKYSTAAIPLEDDAYVTIQFEENNHVTAYRRREVATSNLVSTLDVQLTQVENVQEIAPNISNPGSSDYFSLSGYIKDLNNGPSTAYIGIQYEYPLNPGEFEVMWAHSQYPDLSGYYEFLLPKDVDLLISIQDTFCGNYLTEFDERIFRQLEAEAFGPFSTNVILPNYINPMTTPPWLSISGDMKACDLSDIDFAEITIRIVEADGRDYTSIRTIDNGALSFLDTECKSLPLDLFVSMYDMENNRFSDTLNMTVNESDFHLNIDTLTACNPGIPGRSEIIITLNGDTYAFNEIKARWEGGDIVSDEVTASGATFVIPNAVLGDNSINNLELVSFFTGDAFIGVEDSVLVQFTTLNNNFAIGTISGLFTDFNGAPFSGSGSINLVF